MMNVQLVASELANRAKWAFTTRRVKRDDAKHLLHNLKIAQPGDLILARVESIGSHKRIQLTSGRPSELYTGDLVVLACGARYASDQYEGIAELCADGADMLASGGIIGLARDANTRMSGPTRLIPLGILCHDNSQPMNVSQYALPVVSRNQDSRITTIVAIGASMNAGKTTAVASLSHGLTRAGYRVAAIKATGTGAFGDYNAYVDAGANFVADFVDAGLASTYQAPIDSIVNGLSTLIDHAVAADCDVAVVELADGLFQRETSSLLELKKFRASVDSVLFAAPCAASAVGGYDTLCKLGWEPDIVTGKISASPLALSEAQAATGMTIISRDALRDPSFAGGLFTRTHARMEAGKPLTSMDRLVHVV